MPFLEVPSCHERTTKENSNSDRESLSRVRLFYRSFGTGPVKVLFIMGLASTHGMWHAQLLDLVSSMNPNEGDESVQDSWLHSYRDDPSFKHYDDSVKHKSDRYTCLVFDNRGAGHSSIPEEETSYSTEIMAKDALLLMDHLGWEKAHIVGYSMGGMISCKLASISPERVLSLALISSTFGGPLKVSLKLMRVAYKIRRAKTVEQRAKADLLAHYSSAHLKEKYEGKRRKEFILKKYVNAKEKQMPNEIGTKGQLHACGTHNISSEELEKLNSGFLISIIHGRQDIVLHISKGEEMYLSLRKFARMATIPGGHLLLLENHSKVTQNIKELIEASESGINREDWTKGNTFRKAMRMKGYKLFHKRAVAKDLDVLADILTHANVGKVFLIKDCVESFSSK